MNNLNKLIDELNKQLKREITSDDIIISFCRNKVYIKYSENDYFTPIELKEPIDMLISLYYSEYNRYQGQDGDILVKQGYNPYPVTELSVQLSIQQPNNSTLHIGTLTSNEVDKMLSIVNDIRISTHEKNTKFKLLYNLLSSMTYEDRIEFLNQYPDLKMYFYNPEDPDLT